MLWIAFIKHSATLVEICKVRYRKYYFTKLDVSNNHSICRVHFNQKVHGIVVHWDEA